MKTEGLTKTFYADGAIGKRLIVKAGSADNKCAVAAAAADLSIGVADSLGADAAGDPVDVIMGGIAEVILGGAVTRGQALTADASGKAVVAAAGNRTIGVAMQSGVADDIGSVLISQGTV